MLDDERKRLREWLSYEFRTRLWYKGTQVNTVLEKGM